MSELVPAVSDLISDFTLRMNLPLWMNNLAENLPNIRRGWNIADLPKKKGEPCIVVGAGPSLKYYNHLEMIRKAGWKHPVLACDKVLGACLKQKIVPYAVASIDGSPQIHGFYTAGIIRKYAMRVHAVFGAFVHHDIAEDWVDYGGSIYWFIPLVDMPVDENKKINFHSISHLMVLLTKNQSLMSGVGNVGSFLWNLAFELGCDPIILVGFDFSEQLHDIADAVYFHQFAADNMRLGQDEKTAQDNAAKVHQLESNPDFISSKTEEDWLAEYFQKGEPVRYLVNPVWKYYRNVLASYITQSKKNTINATGNGCLHTEAKDKDGKYILKTPNFSAQKLEDVLEKYK